MSLCRNGSPGWGSWPDRRSRRNAGNDELTAHQFKGRREDQRLVTGAGRYTTDNQLEGQVAQEFADLDDVEDVVDLLSEGPSGGGAV